MERGLFPSLISDFLVPFVSGIFLLAGVLFGSDSEGQILSISVSSKATRLIAREGFFVFPSSSSSLILGILSS